MQRLDPQYGFGSGKENPCSLHLVTKPEGNKVIIELTVDETHCCFPGILHGGITFAMLDEVMCYAIFEQKVSAVTLSATIDFIKPSRVGHSLRAEGWIEQIDGKLIKTASLVTDLDTAICIAKASGMYKVVDFSKFAA
jgi:uncharacterized protein (TIGR00369 family)